MCFKNENLVVVSCTCIYPNWWSE